jgi:hypothetical protein
MRSSNFLEVIQELPEAVELPVFFKKQDEFQGIEEKKAIVVADKVVSIVSKHYRLITHQQAFKTVIDALQVPSEGVQYDAVFNNKRAFLRLMFSDVLVKDDTEAGIRLGVEIRNSYDRTMSLGMQVKRDLFEKGKKYIVFYAERLVCSNGMTVKVPLSELSEVELSNLNPEKVLAEERQDPTKSAELSRMNVQVRHYGKKFDLKFQNLLLMANASKNYLEKTIQLAIKTEYNEELFRKWLAERNFSVKAIDGLIDEFKLKEQNKWEAYNMITAYASHETKNLQLQESLRNDAWDLIG